MKILIFLAFCTTFLFSSAKTDALSKAYPDAILYVKDNKVYFKDNSTLLYDDKKVKKDVLNNADIEDTLNLNYPTLQPLESKKTDIGRVRNEAFLKKLYGKNENAIKKNLVDVTWLPSHENKTLKFNSRQGAAKALQKVSNELDKLPKNYMRYLTNIGGTFKYRKIAKTNRLSAHSFGISIDINVKHSAYWQWSKTYTNEIPKKIVYIFEKNGFIWGGRWEHFDTMHFEYRPELTQN